jgi:hypothetical protein
MLTSARHFTLTHFNALYTLTSYSLISIFTLSLHLHPTFSLEFCIKFCGNFWCLPHALRIPRVLLFFNFSHGVKLGSLGTTQLFGLLYQPRMIYDDESGAVGGMRIRRGNRSTRRKTAPVPLCPPQIPHDLTWTWTRAAAVRSRRLIAWHGLYPTCNFERRCKPILFLFWILNV